MQIYGETVEIVTDFIFLGSKITADHDCGHEIKRHLLLRKKVMTSLDSILLSRDIYFAIKGLSSQGYGFSSGPHSVRPLHHDPTVLGGPTWHGVVSLS